MGEWRFRRVVSYAALITSELVYRSVIFLTLPIVTTALGANGFGLYSLFMVNTVFFNMFFMQLLGNYLLVNYFKLGELRILLHIKAAFSVNCMISFIFFGVMSVIWWVLNIRGDYILTFALAIFAATVGTISQAFLAIFQSRHELNKVAKVNSLLGMLLLLGTGGVYFLFGSKGWFYYAMVYPVAYGVVAVYLLFWHRIIVRKILQHRTVPKLEYIRHCLTLLPNTIFGWLRGNMDRYYVSYILGLSALGVYSAGFQLGAAIGILNAIVLKVYNPYLFSVLKNPSIEAAHRLRRTTHYTIAAIGAAVVVVVIGAVCFSHLLFGPEFKGMKGVSVIVSLAYFLQCITSMFSAILFYDKENSLISKISGLSLVVHIFLMVVFVNMWEINGAAAAFLMSWLVQLFFMVRAASETRSGYMMRQL